MQPRWIILIIGVVIAGLVAGYSLIGYKVTPTPTATPTLGAEVWGINVLTFPFPYTDSGSRLAATERAKIWDQQIAFLKTHYISAVRLVANRESMADLDIFVNKLYTHGIAVVMVLEDNAGPSATPALEQEHGYTFAKELVAHYKDQVEAYQLGNEIGGATVKPSFPGTKLTDYDREKMNLTIAFLKGASQAVKEIDPTAKRVVNINSVTTAIVEEAIRQGVGFEVIGWNWFSDFGTNIENPVIHPASGETFPFLATLVGFQKELWLTEVSQRGGKEQGEAAQAAFLTQAITIGKQAGFTGFFPFVLVEDVVGATGYGLLDAREDANGLWQITGERPAMQAYADLIEN